MLIADINPIVALIVGLLSGIISVYILSSVIKWLMDKQENVNWSADDALLEKGIVYLKIPAKGTGIVRVKVNGVEREFKAKSSNNKEIPTGTKIQVEETDSDTLFVSVHS